MVDTFRGGTAAVAESNSQPRSTPWRDALALVRGILPWLLLALLLRWLVVEPRWIPSGSMLPTLQLEDRVLVQKLLPRLGVSPGVGAIVVFHPPQALLDAGYDSQAALIKRVVAVGGDEVEVKAGRLWRNGVAIDPDWSSRPMGYILPPTRVPPGHLLVLGDNRNASLDSHLWGPLPANRVIGTAIWRYWPLERFGPLRFSAPDPQGWQTANVG